MRARRSLLVALLALVPACGFAAGSDFRSIGPGPAVMYDAPGGKARKVYAAPAGMPVEIIIGSGDWSRVRDANGDLAWVENKSLSARRMLVVEAAQATVRKSPADDAAPAFSAAKGVLLEMLESPSSSWIKVRHRDGDTGYVKAADVWGE